MTRSTALVLVLLVMLIAAAAPWLAVQNPYDLEQLDVANARLAPGAAPASETAGGPARFWLGTDDQGRDVYSAILYGLRTSLAVGLSSTALALLVGGGIGLAAAWVGGALDAALMRAVDLQLSFPAVLVALVLLSVFGQGSGKVVAALAIAQWAYFARTVRGTAVVELAKDYISAARGLALPTHRIVLMHLLPNCLPPIAIIAAVQVAAAVSLEATLSFLGLGVPITRPSLGLLIANGFQFLLSGEYWMSLFPGVALVLLIASINAAGADLRSALDPRRA